MVATNNVQKTPPEEATFNLVAYLKERQKLCDSCFGSGYPHHLSRKDL